MDDENKEDQNPATLPVGDQKTLQEEGVEILGKDSAMDESENKSAEVKPAEKTPAPEKNQYNIPPKKDINKDDDDVRPLRTYKSDVEEAIEHNRLSAVKIAAAQSDKDASSLSANSSQSKTGKGLLIGAIVIGIFAIAVGIGTYIFSKTQSALPAPAASLPQSLVDVTSSQKVTVISGDNSMSDFEAKIQMLKIQGGFLSQIVPVAENGIVIATSSDFFVALGTNVPEQILQSLDGTFTFGAYASNANHPFLILGIKSFDNAFPGMLAWEKTITTDLQFFIAIDHPDFAPGDTAPVFSDKIILNKDIRELDDASGTPEILYSFTNTNTLVITTDETTMSQLITKLNAAKVVR